MKRIVILGGGYAGITVARGLKGIQAEVILVNRHSYHHLTTMLHQPAVGGRDYRDLSVEIRKVLLPPAKLVRGRVDAIDLKARNVDVRQRGKLLSLPYDLLVVALGWEPQFYNIPGLESFALTLGSLNASRLARDRIEESLLALDDAPEQGWRSTVVIGGGGLAGVELAGELLDSRAELVQGLDLRPRDIRLVMIEGAPTILPGLDPWIAEQTMRYLMARGVRCITGCRITRIDDHRLTLSDHSVVEAGSVFWTGGVRGNSILERNGFEVMPNGRVPVNSRLQSAVDDRVFIIGDCAHCVDDQSRPMPPTAWLAVQHGQLTAGNIRRMLSGQPMAPFKPQTGTVLLSLGRRYALGILAGRRVKGAWAAMLKDLLAFRHIYNLGGPILTAEKFRQWWPYLLHLHRA